MKYQDCIPNPDEYFDKVKATNFDMTHNSFRDLLKKSITEPYRAKFFNDYIFFSLKENILKRVIVNRMSGSSWRFRKSLYINLKFLQEDGNFLK